MNSNIEYLVKDVVCDYGIFKTYNGKEELIEICNSRENALLIADVLNCDLGNIRYKCIKCANYNIGGGIDDIYQCKDCKL